MSKSSENKKRSPLIDETERKAIRHDLDTNMLVEAGAGSGKTSSLIDRIKELIGEGRANIKNIAAVTFTRKAAAELKERFQLEIEKSLEDSEGDRKERFKEALMDLEQGFIGTIHSFCARLLRERPVEAGVDPAFIEMEETDDQLMQEEVWDRHVIELMTDNEKSLDFLDKLGVSTNDLKDTYKKLSLYPEVEIVKKEIPPPDIGDGFSELQKFLSYAKQHLPDRVPANGWDSLQKSIKSMLRMIKVLNPSEPKDFFRIVGLMESDSSTNITQNRWPVKPLSKEIKSAADNLRENILLPLLHKWRSYRHYQLMNIVEPAIKRCIQKRADQSKLNFQDLLMKASELLRDNQEVREYFKKRFTHLLVDEFQDTDPIQAEIMLYLTGEDTKEKNWQKLKPALGALFIVGDPKQSIYRFRRADIDTYNHVMDLVEKSGGKLVKLTSNFRSTDQIGSWVNPVFEGRFPAEATKYQAAWGKMHTVRESDSKHLSGVRKITIDKVYRHSSGPIADIDSERIALWIKYAINGNVKIDRTDEEKNLGLNNNLKPEDFLILLRNKKMIPVYASKLEKYGIPYEVSGGNAWSNAEGLSEVVKVLKAIVDPDSDIALVATLRGLFFGLSDDQLYRYKKSGGKFSFFAPIPEKADQDVKDAFEFSYKTLQRYKKWSVSHPPSVTIESILEDVGLVPYLLSGEMGGSRTGNIMKVLEMIQVLESSGNTDLSDIVDEIEYCMSDGEIDEIDIAHGARGAVRIMNLHKAKGLESPVVFLANPTGKHEFPSDEHIIRDGDKTLGYFSAVHHGTGYQPKILATPPKWDVYEEEENKYSAAETERLIYVACTRARNLLVISNYPEKHDISPWNLVTPFLGDVKELESHEVSAMESHEELKVTKSMFDKAVKLLTDKVEKAGEATYILQSVTSLVKDLGNLPAWESNGRGIKWGNVIHRVLEAINKGINNSDLNILIGNVLREEGRPAEEKTNVLNLIDEIRKSEFWQELQKTEKKFVEVPFSIRLKPSDLGYPDKEDMAILSGTIDLIYKNKDGWNIVDYKTDDISKDKDSFIKYYAPQVKAYCQYWEKVSGEKVAKAGLFFTYSKEFVSIIHEQTTQENA